VRHFVFEYFAVYSAFFFLLYFSFFYCLYSFMKFAREWCFYFVMLVT